MMGLGDLSSAGRPGLDSDPAIRHFGPVGSPGKKGNGGQQDQRQPDWEARERLNAEHSRAQDRKHAHRRDPFALTSQRSNPCGGLSLDRIV